MAKKGTKTAGRKNTRSTKEKPVARGRQIKKGKAELKRAVTGDAKVKKAAPKKAEPMESQGTKSYPPEELKHFKELILTRSERKRSKSWTR